MNHTSGRELRVGLIGCGKMGVHHLRAIKATPGAKVIGVADPQASRELLEGVLPGDAAIVASAAELLALKPDVVHIVTPPETHAPLALQAIDAGCHVYVEKPFTPTRDAARDIFARAAQRGVLVCAGHQYLFEPPALKARDTIGRIGRLVHVESYFSFRMVRRTITPAEQAKDILPHAVYPLVEQLRAGTGLADEPIEIAGVDARASGDVYALLRLADRTGILMVTLSGRPIEQYQHLVGTNGWMRVDYITGSVTELAGPGTGPGVLFTPYRRAFQTLSGATKGFYKLIFGRKTPYPGLTGLIERFYAAIAGEAAAPISPGSIAETVSLCEFIGQALDQASEQANAIAGRQLEQQQALLPAIDSAKGMVLVTGGTGLLGRRVVQELRTAGFGVRVLARRMPWVSARVAGVEYVAGDLARPLSPDVTRNVTLIAHCAAETAGGKDDHQRNSIAATRHVIEAAAAARVPSVIHISSLAVLKPGHQVGGGPLDERTPVDAGNLERGPYVWGKADSELLAQRLGEELGVTVKVIRPGPLVDYAEFQPPGRLGRELGPWFVAVGGRATPLSVCDVGTAARVIRSYAEDFAQAPPLVNLVEAPPPTRGELAERVRAGRTDLKFLWVPAFLVRAMSGPAKMAQRLLLGSTKPVDVYAAFASERYNTDLAAAVIRRAADKPAAPRPVPDREPLALSNSGRTAARPRCVLVCHAGSRVNLEAVAPWLASFTDLVGMVVIDEQGKRLTTRIRRELSRIGVVRFLDVVAFRLYYAAVLARGDVRWMNEEFGRIARRFAPIPDSVEVLRTSDPNGADVQAFLERLAPDLMVARCKRVLKERIFAVPKVGTFVLHPGVCPEYRNAHGAFWALARRDLSRVGLTLLKVDRGVDTGPVYGYYSYDFDEIRESHIVVMTRLVTDNFDAMRDKLLDICQGRPTPIDTTGRISAVWGQPWLSTYLRWKWEARRKLHARAVA